MKRIGVLTSGGDCPGLNAVLRGVARAASNLGWEVLGFHDGFEGLLPPARYEALTICRTAGIMPLGGTILGTTNKGHFLAKTSAGMKSVAPVSSIAAARETLRVLEIEGLIVIGGDGSLTTAYQLAEAGIAVVGVPKTIDNDIAATSTSFGFDSAVACVTDALDRLHTTATSHKRLMVLEVMGRHAGWIALHGGLAGGADVILLPEIPFDLEKVATAVLQREKASVHSTILVVAEGAKAVGGEAFYKSPSEGEHRLGGIGEHVAAEIAKRTGKDTRCCVLGHLQRGGAPTPRDRILGTRFGVKAVELIAEKKFGRIVSYRDQQVHDASLAEAIDALRLVPLDDQLMEAARALGISFGN